MKIVKSRESNEIELDSILPDTDEVKEFFGVIALYQPEKKTIYRLHATPDGDRIILQFIAVVCLGGIAFDTSPTLFRTWSRHYGPYLKAVLNSYLDGEGVILEFFKTEQEFTAYVATMIKESGN